MIFISHSSKDDSVANALCDYLEMHNIKCWIDHRDATPGSPWENSIVDAIKDSNLMLLVFSEQANLSRHVGRELTIGGKNEMDIIPLRIEDVEPSGKFEYYLGDTQWYNAIGTSLDNHLNKLTDHIKAILEKIKSETSPKPKVERRFFRGVYLPIQEVEFLEEIESITGESFEYLEFFEDLINYDFEKLALIINKNNAIDGIGICNCNIERIPESIRKIEDLNALILDNVNLKSLPGWIDELKHLDFLCLSNNKLESLPNSIVNLKYLGVLDLSNNIITDLPESFGHMEFQILNLSYNNLSTLPFSFLEINADEIYLSENPLNDNPDLRTRFIIERLKSIYNNIDIELSKFKFEFEERDDHLGIRINDLIHDYYQLRFVSPEDIYDSERKQKQIRFELINIGYTTIDFLIDVFLTGDDVIKPVAEEILDFILSDIEPKWKEIVLNEDFS